MLMKCLLTEWLNSETSTPLDYLVSCFCEPHVLEQGRAPAFSRCGQSSHAIPSTESLVLDPRVRLSVLEYQSVPENYFCEEYIDQLCGAALMYCSREARSHVATVVRIPGLVSLKNTGHELRCPRSNRLEGWRKGIVVWPRPCGGCSPLSL